MSSGFIPQGGEDTSKHSSNEPAKSLYETLQDNYAKKQELLNEANSLKNQIHRLDDEDIEFLQGLRQSTQETEAKIQEQVDDEMKKFKEALGKLPDDDDVLLQEEILRLEQIKGGLKKRKARDNGIHVLTRKRSASKEVKSQKTQDNATTKKPSLISDYDSDE